MMRVLLLGADGQLGFELGSTLAPLGEISAATRTTIDLADANALRSALRAHAPDLVVNAAAWTDVDGAEKDPAGAMRINRDAVAILGEESVRAPFALVHVSTDFVFDGTATRAYVETDATNPLNVYGRSKLEGERALLDLDAPAIVLRTAWVWSLRRKSFVTTILRLARERETMKVVADQIGNPTLARDLAVAVARILDPMRADVVEGVRSARGLYHAAGTGAVSRFDFARAILDDDPARHEHVVRTLEPVPSEAFPLPALRPKHAPLDTRKLRDRFGVELPAWRASLREEIARR